MDNFVPVIGKTQPSLHGILFHAPPPTIEQLVKCLPTFAQASSCLNYYSECSCILYIEVSADCGAARFIDWYLHAIHFPTFKQQLTDMFQEIASGRPPPDIAFVSSFYIVSAMALDMMPTERAVRDGFGTAGSQAQLADTWRMYAMQCLNLSNFMETPTVEALRSILILTSHYVAMSPGESCGPGMRYSARALRKKLVNLKCLSFSILAVGIQTAVRLNLHRDPSRFPGKYTPLQGMARGYLASDV